MLVNTSRNIRQLTLFQRSEIALFILGIVWGIIVSYLIDSSADTFNWYNFWKIFNCGPIDNNIPVPMSIYPMSGWRTPNTIDVKILASTPFARFEMHKLRTESGQVVNDWVT